MTKKFEKMTKILGEMTKMFHPAPPPLRVPLTKFIDV
jgi:hypothetical protein